MSASDLFSQLQSDLQGVELSYLWRGYGSAIFLEFGTLTSRSAADGSPSHPDGEISLMIEWSWRLENATSILCGSWSKEELWEPTFDRIRNATVIDLSLFGRLPEVSLALSDHHHLASFSTTDGDPQWSLVDRRGKNERWLTVLDGALFEHDGSLVRD